ncbi:MAG: hypothetical protein AAB131_09025 [Actinomycetota bacterium]
MDSVPVEPQFDWWSIADLGVEATMVEPVIMTDTERSLVDVALPSQAAAK